MAQFNRMTNRGDLNESSELVQTSLSTTLNGKFQEHNMYLAFYQMSQPLRPNQISPGIDIDVDNDIENI
jgi:hypothetical protein